MLDARCTIQGQVWISRLNPSMNSNSSIHSNCCANSSSLSCRLDRGCSIATGIIVEYASVRSHQLRSFHGSSRYYVCCVHPLSTVHCMYQNGSILLPSPGSEVSKASYQQLFNKYVIQVGTWEHEKSMMWYEMIISWDLISFHLIWFHVIWFHFIWSDLISCHVIWFYLIWFLFISSRLIWFLSSELIWSDLISSHFILFHLLICSSAHYWSFWWTV